MDSSIKHRWKRNNWLHRNRFLFWRVSNCHRMYLINKYFNWMYLDRFNKRNHVYIHSCCD